MTRSMLKAKSLPKTFLAKIITRVVFLLNKCLAKIVFGRTPEEAQSGHKLEVSFLRIF